MKPQSNTNYGNESGYNSGIEQQQVIDVSAHIQGNSDHVDVTGVEYNTGTVGYMGY